MVLLFWDYSMDDAFITFRYAENFASGHGFVFNPGESPVEAYSNFLWLLILAGFYKLGLPIVLLAKMLGPLFFVLTGFIWYRFAFKNVDGFSYLIAPSFLFSAYVAFWAVSGLELGLYACLLSLFVLAVHYRRWYSWLLVPVVTLSRPEGFAISVFIIVLHILLNRRSNEFRWKLPLINMGVLVVTIIALTLFRLQTFGYPLPNTVYAKSVIAPDGLFQLLKGLLYLLPLTLLFLYGLWRAFRTSPKPALIIIFSGVFLLQSLINCLADAVMNFHFRYMVVFLPFFLATAYYGFSKLNIVRYQSIILPILIISLLAPGWAIYKSVQTERKIIAAQDGIIHFINELPGSPRISLTDIGRIPYYTRAKYNDLWGLASINIVRDSLFGSREIKRFPDYFILVGYKPENKTILRFGHENMIKTHSFFDKIYQLQAVGLPVGADISVPGYYYLAYLKNEKALDSLINIYPIK